MSRSVVAKAPLYQTNGIHDLVTAVDVRFIEYADRDLKRYAADNGAR